MTNDCSIHDEDGTALMCGVRWLQASERLVQLAYAVLERFSLGIDSNSSSQKQTKTQQQQPYSNGITSRTSSLSMSSSSRVGVSGSSVAVIASASVEYTAFAPLVVSTLKVCCALGV